MAKYDEEFRYRAVEEYLLRGVGYRVIAAEYGIEFSMLRRWVASYREHGRSGLRKKLGRYSADVKLEVLNRALGEGLSDRQVATLYDIRSVGDVGKWRRQYNEGGLAALEPRRRGRLPMQNKEHSPSASDRPDVERTQKELLEELAYLRAENAYLKKLKALIEAERAGAQAKKRK